MLRWMLLLQEKKPLLVLTPAHVLKGKYLIFPPNLCKRVVASPVWCLWNCCPYSQRTSLCTGQSRIHSRKQGQINKIFTAQVISQLQLLFFFNLPQNYPWLNPDTPKATAILLDRCISILKIYWSNSLKSLSESEGKQKPFSFNFFMSDF